MPRTMALAQRFYLPLFLLALIAAVAAAALPFLRAASQSGGFRDSAGGVEEQIVVILHADQAPAPGGVVHFTMAVRPLRAAPDLTITWELPEGGELVGGPPVERLGAVAAGETITQSRQVRFADPGVYTVKAQAEYRPDIATRHAAIGVLFFTIDTAGSSASDIDPRIVPHVPPPFKPTIDKSGMAVAADWGPDVPDGCFVVSGFLNREDRRPRANPPGYNDVTGPAVPVHHVRVELREEDDATDDSYGFTNTDANGIFTFSFCDDDGLLSSDLELYYRVCSEVWDGNYQMARIEQTSKNAPYCFTSGIKESEGGNVNFDFVVYNLNSLEAAIFNIADSLYYATKFWNDNLGSGAARMDKTVKLSWERGRNLGSSSYNRGSTTINLADNASDPDEWDDTIILHEWGHFADHQLSCNRSPGGPHSISGVNAGTNGDKLAWGEGFGDYYQSAVRATMPNAIDTSFYIEPQGTVIDLELVPNANALSEGGVAALLLDFLDTAADGSDTVFHGHPRIQRILTDPAFKDDPACNITRFIKVWKDLANPTDAATAATVVQNVNIANPFAAAIAGSGTPLAVTVPDAPSHMDVTASPHDYRWWDQATLVIDNSASMAAPAESPKIDAVKALIGEQVADLTKNPLGTEFNIYSFHDGSNDPRPELLGRFFANQINPVVNALQADGPDGGCPTRGLYAMSQAVQNKYDGQAWLYTDGDYDNFTSVDFIQQQLNNRLVHGSIVLLGGCGTLPTPVQDVSGNAKNYLGLAADGSHPAGIVPYLLTAIGTGGQFLFVGPDQLANAADILRAQAAHSAGAGRWSDYVSFDYTYRWDRLHSWEYGWIDPTQDDYKGTAIPNPLLIAGLPTMNVYGVPYNHLYVDSDGYINMGDLATPGNAYTADLNIFYRNGLDWYFDANPNLAAANSPDAPDAGYRQNVFQEVVGDWVVITLGGQDDEQRSRAFQALINTQTGEIRYQYLHTVTDDRILADISISESDITIGYFNDTQIAYQDDGHGVPGTGYKLTPAPPQPSKSYTVAVDSQISAIGFLMTGYSGTFNDMVINYPDGTALDCTDTANVICLSLNGGLVQYKQVNVNARTGVYTATISGNGTFSFNAMAASPIQAKGLGNRARPFGENFFQLDLGRRADGDMMAGWLQTATGARFGSPFTYYDDGAHNDGAAGDGLFGSDGFFPLAQGVAYLWMQGTFDGESITRSDPTPFNFQPVKVEADPAYVQGFMGGQEAAVVPGFRVTNQDSVQHCYNWEVEVPPGFAFVNSSGQLCVPPGETGVPYYSIHYPDSGQPGGTVADISANFVEAEEGRIAGVGTTKVAIFRPIVAATFDNRWDATFLRPNGTDTVTMSVLLLDDQGQVSGWTGFRGYTLDTTLGTVTTPTGEFVNGRMDVVFTAGTTPGKALITFVLGDAASALQAGKTTTTTLEIRVAEADTIDLTATPTDLRADDQTTSQLVATLVDQWGDPVVGQRVRLSVSDDNGLNVNGTINGNTVFVAQSDANGKVTATYTRGTDRTFLATVRAEALVPEGDGFRVTHEDSEILSFSGQPPGTGQTSMFIPLIRGAD